jgi:hypothetical protein
MTRLVNYPVESGYVAFRLEGVYADWIRPSWFKSTLGFKPFATCKQPYLLRMPKEIADFETALEQWAAKDIMRRYSKYELVKDRFIELSS